MAEWRDELERRCGEAALDPAVRDDVQREVAEHLDDRVEDLMAGGTSAAAAARLVADEIPDVAAIRRLARSRRGPRAAAMVTAAPIVAPGAGPGWWLAAAVRDLRHAARTFLKDRAFTLAAVVTLALCLAANVTIFTLVNTVLFEALTVPDPAALVHVGNAYPNAGAGANIGSNSAVPDYFDRVTAVAALAEQALLRTHGVSVGGEDAERLQAMTVTPSLLPMLQVAPASGRVFIDGDAEPGRPPTVLLSDGLWRRRFGAAADIVGQSVVIGGVAHEVIGIMPAGFRFMDDEVALWLPAAFTADERSDASRHSNNWTFVGRLAPSASLAQVQAQVDALNAANLERFPALKSVLLEAGFRSVATPLVEVLTGEVRRPLHLLWGGVGCVLLIGVVNLAALVLARATTRRTEIATRLALGAEPGRVRAQLVTEHLLLAVAGGVGGMALAAAIVAWLPQASVSLVPPGRVVALAPRVWAYAAALVVLVGVILGLVATRAVATAAIAATLRDDGRSRTGARGARRLRQVLVVGQVAVACMLLVGAGMLFESFRRLLAVDTGFETSVVTGAVSLPEAAYGDAAARRTFFDRTLDAVRSLPGVTAAGATSSIPFGASRSDSVAWPEGWTPAPGQSFVSPDQIRVSAGYFEAMGIPAVAGRTFDGRDTTEAEPVVIVDERLAQRFWPDRDAVGRYMLQPISPEAMTRPTPDNLRRYRVVGVVRAIKQHALVTPAGAVGAYYFPFGQDTPGYAVVAVASSAAPAVVTADLRRVVAGLDPRLPLFDVEVMRDRVDDSLKARRATMTLAVAFGILALVLSAVGLYGVLVYLVAQRTREIGIRMALGGSAPAIAALVFRESVTVVGIGLAVGLGGAAGLGRLLASEVVDVQPFDLTSIGVAIALLLGAALAATAVPARRALRVDPAVTLAAE